MKKIFFTGILMTFVLVSCNQKNKEAGTTDTHMMNNDSTMMDHDSTMTDGSHKMMDEKSQMYSCSMHPEVTGMKGEKCSKCGMDLTVPVTEAKEESK